MSILQSFEEELVKERLWLLPTAVPRWPYESLSISSDTMNLILIPNKGTGVGIIKRDLALH